MSNTEYDKLFDHTYDGIQEYDNPLPSWWMWLFFLTIAHSVLYFVYYEAGGPGLTPQQEYDEEMAIAAEQRKNAPAPALDDATLAAAVGDANTVAAGKTLFMTKCLACHGPDGGGLIGPNLTDDYWIHGKGTPRDIYNVVYNGVPAKGMIAWGTMLTPDELKQAVAFVASLHGTTPTNPKAPEGEKVQ